MGTKAHRFVALQAIFYKYKNIACVMLTAIVIIQNQDVCRDMVSKLHPPPFLYQPHPKHPNRHYNTYNTILDALSHRLYIAMGVCLHIKFMMNIPFMRMSKIDEAYTAKIVG